MDDIDTDIESLTKRYGKDVAEWLTKELEQMFLETHDYCIDNVRVCRMSDPTDVDRYEDDRTKGCCGYEDKEVTYPETNEVYQIGCNYGH